MTDLALATYSNYALYSAMGVLALAMIGYAAYLAGLVPARDAAATTQRAAVTAQRRDALVGVGRPGATTASAPDAAPTVPAADGTGADGNGAAATASPRARKAAGIAQSLTQLAALLLAASAALRGLSVHRAPLGNMYEFALVATMFTVGAFAIWSTRRDLRWLGLFVVTPALLTLGLAMTVWYTEAAELMPSLKSYWLVIHVTVATIAVAVFALAFAVTVLYLARARQAPADSVLGRLAGRLPQAPALERLSYSLHIVAFPLWTFSVIAGAIWARQAWGSYWNWDPKEVWSFVIWVVYAAYLHARATAGWSAQRAAWIAVAGFACIVMNYAIVNMFFVGQHSYSGL